MTAQDLCLSLSAAFAARGDGRSAAMAKTLTEIGEVLGDQHSADALRSFWALGLEAEPAGQPLEACLARKATLGELLSLCGGVPRALDYHHVVPVGEALVAHYQGQEDPRAAAMARTFARELDAAVEIYRTIADSLPA